MPVDDLTASAGDAAVADGVRIRGLAALPARAFTPDLKAEALAHTPVAGGTESDRHVVAGGNR
ncbi:hypothetical protein Q0Z83_024880 [Actinoplanes sichuanensis]|nr:hypothetical protein Q0Z83_024880 [Actinoplanes sichuanensis]